MLKQFRASRTWPASLILVYLSALLGIYVNGARLTSLITAIWGPPFKLFNALAGTWHTWLWSIDYIARAGALALVAATVLGGFLGLVLHQQRSLSSWISVWRSRWFRLMAAVLAILVAWYFRVDVSLGDSPRLTAMLGTNHVFIMHAPLASLTYYLAYQMLGGWPQESVVALVNCVLGGMWVYLLLTIASEAEGWRQKLLLVSVLPAGGFGIFIGYREIMPLGLVAAAAYVYFSLRAFNQGANLYPASLALGIAVAAQGEMLLLGPSYLLLLWASWRTADRTSAILPAMAFTAIPTVALILYALLHSNLIFGTVFGDIWTDVQSGGRLVPIFRQPAGEYEHYTMLSFYHVMELVNELLVVAPFALLLAVPASFHAWRQRREPQVRFLAAIAACATLVFVLWNPNLGMEGDWDLYVPPLMLLLVACALLWPSEVQVKQESAWAGAMAGFSFMALVLNVSRFKPLQQWDAWYIVQRQIQTKTDTHFGGFVDLLGFTLPKQAYVAGDMLTVKLFWRLRRSTRADYTAGFYLINTAGQNISIIAQDDHRPTTWYRYTSGWHVGEVVGDAHIVTIPPETQPGTYQLWVTLYDLPTLRRLPVDGENDADYIRLPDIQVELPP